MTKIALSLSQSDIEKKKKQEQRSCDENTLPIPTLDDDTLYRLVFLSFSCSFLKLVHL